MAKKRKKRQKKIYSVKELRKKWKMERFDERRYQAKVSTIVFMICAIVLVGYAVWVLFGLGIYEPIKPEDAICRSVQFESYHSSSSRYYGGAYIKLTNQESVYLSGDYTYANMALEEELYKLEPDTTLYLKLNEYGTVLEIKTAQKEILSFDYAQKQMRKISIIIFVIGILALLGAIACAVYAMIKIIKHKVFAPSKSIYKK